MNQPVTGRETANQSRDSEDGTRPLPLVTDFVNFREYVIAYYKYRKGKTRGFSYSVLARRAGLNSGDHMRMIIVGQRNIGMGSAVFLAKACGLGGLSLRYFLNLVLLTQCDVEQARNHYQNELDEIRRVILKRSHTTTNLEVK